MKDFEHPSYGIISVSKCNSYGKELFGANIPVNSFIKIKISTAILSRQTDRDLFEPKDGLIEVLLSPIQWAELLTNMNTLGVACTISYVQGEGLISFKPYENRIEESIKRFEVEMSSNDSHEYISKLKSIVDESRLSQKAKKEMVHYLNIIDGRVKGTAEFYIQEFQRNADKVVSSAKAEISAYKESILGDLGQQKFIELLNQYKLLNEK